MLLLYKLYTSVPDVFYLFRPIQKVRSRKDSIMEIIKQRISINCIQKDLEYLASFDKNTGTEGGEKAASYIYEQLKDSGIDCKLARFEEYLSDPISSTVEVPALNLQIEATPRSSSVECAGVEGELVFDPIGSDIIYISKEREAFLESLRGKIVMAYTDSEYYCKVMERYGVKALILVWPSDDPLREDTISAVWGTPTADTYLTLPLLPVVGITSRGGKKLMNLMERGPVTVRVSTKLQTNVRTISMPMCEIKGQRDEFVLLSCHYDTWYKGAFDNCAANAAAIELARVFKRYQAELKRGIRIVWWGGHSNGRYAGSTWYCDNYWRDLRKNCIAHFTADLLGSKDGEVLGVKTTGMEGEDFIRSVVDSVDPGVRVYYGRLGRRGEQSFFTADIPFHLYLRYEVAPENQVSTAPGGSWWWHTAEDTIDKIGLNVLEKETQMWYGITMRLANDDRLPFDAETVFDKVIRELKDTNVDSEAEFDFSEIIHAMTCFRDKTLSALNQAKNDNQYNQIVRLAAGSINRLRQTYGSRYSQDLAYDDGLYPRLCSVKGRRKDTMSPKHYLFMRTDFIRQKNRMLEEISLLCERLGNPV